MYWSLLNLESPPKETVKICMRLHFKKLVIRKKLVIQTTGIIIICIRASPLPPAPFIEGGFMKLWSWTSLLVMPDPWNFQHWVVRKLLLIAALYPNHSVEWYLASTKRTHWYWSCWRNHQIQMQWLETVWLGLLILVVWRRIKTNSRWILPS